MNEAVWVSGLALVGSMLAIVILATAAGALLYWLERVSGKNRH